jgi:hypothetical protein
MGRERYRRLPGTILVTIASILALGVIAVYCRQIVTWQANYCKLAADSAEQQRQCEEEALRQAASADSKLKWAEDMADWARELERDGESQRAKEVQAQVDEKTTEAATCRSKATQLTRLAEYYAALMKKYEAAAKRPWRDPDSDPLPEF